MEAMRKNEQELLETFAEYDDNFDSENMKELSDIFAWDDLLDDGEYDEDEWFDEFLEDLNDEDDNFDIEDLFELSKPPGFELYKNENFDAERDGGLDLALYSGFSTYRADSPENKKEPLAIELDNNIDASKIKLKNYPIVMQILSTLSQLVQSRSIFCKCRDFDGRISLLDDYVHIDCKRCGSERDIKSSSMSDVQYIDEMGELFLDFED